MTNKDKLTNLKEKLVKMTGEYCRNNVNEEYETLCKKLIDKLARKRVVPFTVGKMENLGLRRSCTQLELPIFYLIRVLSPTWLLKT